MILLLLFITGFTYAKLNAQTKIPAAANAFKAKYPAAQNVQWTTANKDLLANFILNGLQQTAIFNSNGEWKETDTKMVFDSVPAIVKNGFKKCRYADWTITAITYVDNGKTMWYKIDVEKSLPEQKRSLFFNSQGILVMDTAAQ